MTDSNRRRRANLQEDAQRERSQSIWSGVFLVYWQVLQGGAGKSHELPSVSAGTGLEQYA